MLQLSGSLGCAPDDRGGRAWAARIPCGRTLSLTLTLIAALLPLVLNAAEGAPRPAVTAEGAYTAEVISVARGGLRGGAVYQALAEAAAVTDLAALLGAPAGTVLRVSAIFPHGGDFGGTRLGDLQGVSNIAAYHEPSLFELSVATELAGGRLALCAGRLVADGDFATTEGGGVFLNSSFGWPACISANTRNTGPTFERSGLGVQGAFALTEQVTLRAGVYDGDTLDDPDGDPARYPHGLHVELGHGQGAFALTELDVAWSRGPEGAGRPGCFKVGAWGHTADFADLADPGLSHAGNYGIYLVAEQMLWREPGAGAGASGGEAIRGLTGFVRAGFSPGDRNLYSQTADAGLSYTGLLPGRPADILGLGLAWVRLSEGYRRAERAAGATVESEGEGVVELSYQVVLGDRWSFTPDLQWIRQPGGSRAVGDALVIGLRTRLSF